MDNQGQIIILNGPSSVGKSTTAKALQLRLGPQYLHLGGDTWILEVWPREVRGEQDTRLVGVTQREVSVSGPDNLVIEMNQSGFHIMKGLHVAVQALSKQGYGVIMDICFWEQVFLEDCLPHLRQCPVMLVRLHCPLETVLERFEARPDRFSTGLAHFWFHRAAEVDQYIDYDLELDTSLHCQEESAELIAARLDDGQPLAAFQRTLERMMP